MASDAVGRGAPGGTGPPSGPHGGPPPVGPSRRRASPGRRARLVLAGLLLVPVLEIAVLVQVAGVVGAAGALAAVALGGVAGMVVLRRSGVAAFRRAARRAGEGLTPSREVADATLIFVAGVLLVVPGLVSDAVAVLILMPVTRGLVRRPLERALSRGAASVVQPLRWPGTGRVIPGEVISRPPPE